MYNNQEIGCFTDSGNNLSFMRTLNAHRIYYSNSKVKLVVSDKSTKNLDKIKTSKNIKTKIITMDIETLLQRNVQKPYSISIFDGEKSRSFYLSDYESPEIMLKMALSSILISKYKNYKVYIHNLSSFDSVFLLRILNSMENNITRSAMTRNNGRIINLNINYNKNCNISLRDSMLLLPSSLAKLSKTFNPKSYYKSIFPILFLKNIEPNYNGPVPKYKFFKNITLDEYKIYKQNYKGRLWSLKDETIMYCEMDCKALYYVLVNYNQYVFDLFNLNIVNYPTLSALAFGIFRSKFLKDDFKIPLVAHPVQC